MNFERIYGWLGNATARRGIAGLILALFIASIIALVHDVRSQMALLATATSDNVQWALSQAETEVMALQIATLQGVHAEPPDLDAVRLRFDIFYSRIDTLSNSRVFMPLRGDTGVAENLNSLTSFLDRWVPVIDGPDAALATALPDLAVDIEEAHATVRASALIGIDHFSQSSDLQRASVSKTLFRIAVLTVTLVALLLALVFALFRLALARAREAELHREIRERMEAVIATSLDAVIVSDRHGRIIDYNGAAERIFGFPREQAIGANLADLVVPETYRARHRDGMARFLKTGHGKIISQGLVQLKARRLTGEVFPIDLSLVRAQSRGDEIFVGFIRDISDRVHAETELRAAHDRAIAGEKQKADLLAVMSHEMRTPLNGMLGTLDLIDLDALDARHQRYMRIIRNSGHLLLGHVNDVLDISRLEARKMTMHNRRCDLVALLEDLVEGQAARAKANGNRLVLDPPDPALRDVWTDPDRVRQVMLNLVGNAIKFTKGGTITVTAQADSARSDVALRVSDTGVGIAPADLSRIFEDFVTVDSSYGRQNAGTGLGLGISKRLASVLGGRLSAISTKGAGSCFTLTLPLVAPRGAAPAPTPAEPSTVAPDLPPLRVLLVEDNEINRMVAREMLQRDGHRVTQAEDGAEGVTAALDGAFDVILMDISMPGLDGVQAARQIREAGNRAPIIACTAHALPEEVAAFRRAGMADVLFKPLSMVALRRVLADVLLGTPSPTGETADEDGESLLDWQLLAELSEALEADQIAASLTGLQLEMTAFLAAAPAQIDTDRTALVAEAHRLAGSSGVFGAQALAWHLRRLQGAATTADAVELMHRLEQISTCWQRSVAALEDSGLVTQARTA